MSGTKPRQKSEIKPIMEDDIPTVAEFLHRHMNGKFSSNEWARGLRGSWYDDAPNHGYMLKSEESVVGAICALYSQQTFSDKTIMVCNPHSWCVLEPYRSKSVSLVLALIRQPGFHYTMFSPNKDGEEIFAYLGFKPLDREIQILANIPTAQMTRTIEITDVLKLGTHNLSSQDRKCLEDHQQFDWLRFIFFGLNGEYGFTIYKRDIFKRLPCANILYISNKKLFEGCWDAIRTRLLLKHGLFTTKLASRLASVENSFCLGKSTASAKFYLSESLPPESIHYTYSELVAMDL